MSEFERVTDADFDARVHDVDCPVLVDFTATWCGPCKAMAPAIADLAKEYAGEAEVLALDVDANPRAVERYDIRGVPSFLIFKGKEIVYRASGITNRSALAQAIEAALEQR